MQIFPNKMLASVLYSIIKYLLYTSKVEMTKEKIAFIQKSEKSCNFCDTAYLFIINTFSAIHLIKLFISFSISV